MNFQTSTCSSIICKIEAQILPTDVFFLGFHQFYKCEDTHLDITDYTQIHTNVNKTPYYLVWRFSPDLFNTTSLYG